MALTHDTAAGLELLDVIQLKGVSHFSGCISLQGEGFEGMIFFRDGQIIHAETGGLVGEEAFYEIARRPGLSFALQPNVTTTSHTIHHTWQFLLMESQRLVDEAGRSGGPAAGVPERRFDLVERIRRIPGVVWAALEPKAGAVRPGPEAGDPTAEQGARLGALARVVGEQFRIGEVVGATVQGAERHLLLVATRAHHLFILVQGGAQASATEAEIRRILASRR